MSESPNSIGAGEVGAAAAFTISGEDFLQVIVFADPLETHKEAVFDRQLAFEGWKERPQESSQRQGFVGEGEEEVDAAHLGIAQVVAGIAILPVVPFDLVGVEIVQGRRMEAKRFSSARERGRQKG